MWYNIVLLFKYEDATAEKEKKLCEKVASSELLKKLTDSSAREKC